MSGKNPIAEKIQQRFPETFVSWSDFRGDLSVQVKKDGFHAVCQYLHDDPEMDFDYIVHVSSVDYLGQKERFEVVYEFYSIRNRRRIRVKAKVSEEDCSIDSVTDLWKGAEFMEREVYDMMGIGFLHHPNLKRILLPDEYDEGYPLRKDFPMRGKGWRDTFEFMQKPNNQ